MRVLLLLLLLLRQLIWHKTVLLSFEVFQLLLLLPYHKMVMCFEDFLFLLLLLLLLLRSWKWDGLVLIWNWVRW